MNRILFYIVSFYLVASNVLAQTTNSSTYIQNPLNGVTSAEGIVTKILQLISQVGSVIAVIFLIYSGYLFVKAKGNSGEIEKAKETFFWTIVGIAILLGAWVISTVVVGTVNSIAQ